MPGSGYSSSGGGEMAAPKRMRVPNGSVTSDVRSPHGWSAGSSTTDAPGRREFGRHPIHVVDVEPEEHVARWGWRLGKPDAE